MALQNAPAAEAPGPDELARLHAAIDRLPARYREVIILHCIEGQTHEQIAAGTGVASGTVAARISRGKRMLARHYQIGATMAAAALVAAPLSASAVEVITQTSLAGLSGVALPASVQTLSEGVIHMLQAAKIKVIGAVLAAAVLAGGIGTLGPLLVRGAGSRPDASHAAAPVAAWALPEKDMLSAQPAPNLELRITPRSADA